MASFLGQIIKSLARLRSGGIELSNAKYERRLAEVRGRKKAIRTLSDDAWREQTASLRERVRRGTRLEEVALGAFTFFHEAARRTVGLEPYDVQLLAGLALFDGKLAEMQ